MKCFTAEAIGSTSISW